MEDKIKNKFIVMEKNSVRRAVKEGFSWTVFFFGLLALLIRKQLIPALICFLTFGIAGFYYMFTANRLLKEQLLLEGWEKTPMKSEDRQLLPSAGQKILLFFCAIALIIFSIFYGSTCMYTCLGGL